MRRLLIGLVATVGMSALALLTGCGGGDEAPARVDAPTTTTVDAATASDAPATTADAASGDDASVPDAAPLPDGAGAPDAMPSAATLAVLPLTFDFGAIIVGDQPSKTFTVTASGGPPDATLTVTLDGNAAFQLGSFSTCPGAKLIAGASCTVVIVFTPAASGLVEGNLHIDGDLSGDAMHLTVPLGGTGVAPGAITAAPDHLDFGPVVVGAMSASQPVTVTNTGGTDTGVISVNVTGSDAASFQVSDGCNGVTLAAGATCSFDVTFAPTVAGDLSASIAIAGTPGGTATVAVAGHGQRPAHLTGGGSHTFGPIPVGMTQRFGYNIANDGEVATGTLATIGSGDIGAFSRQSDCPPTLGPAAMCTITVTYAPTTPNQVHLHVVVLASPGGSVTIDATGTAIGLSTLTVTPAKNVTVVSTPAGIDCGDTCAASYPMGTAVELDATIATNTTSILGWRGDCAGIDGCAAATETCTVTVTQSCAASPIVGAELVLKHAGMGRVVSTPEGIDCGLGIICRDDASFEVNSTVVLQATFGFEGPPVDDATWTGCKEDTGPTCTVDIPPEGATVEYSCLPPCGISENP